ncbi:IS1106 transposase [Neisseria meningitidis]|uniref:IS1106 transposase n=1 Tax=Neisseria meningitidis TaxID=487 RepID=A0A378WCJ5_NEIME|nr:IS1106 transposase [Neisseria meningitidis M01-240355]CWP79864.1 IS1106 transposase [Neisseria meningitidis]CWQ19784.1 IS1106 transposase [Neisseria meningitidis]CWQ25052.1 IS1106 transposase [Neisseria meningitidis]CWT63788.1 IS1106 transposase [Neisseria meningitidis]
MSTFFRQTAQAMIAKHIDRFPLLKLDQVIDWQPIEQYLNRQKTRYLRDHRGRPAYPLLSMFKAVLLGQWHSLSNPELERGVLVSRNLISVASGSIFDSEKAVSISSSAMFWFNCGIILMSTFSLLLICSIAGLIILAFNALNSSYSLSFNPK